MATMIRDIFYCSSVNNCGDEGTNTPSWRLDVRRDEQHAGDRINSNGRKATVAVRSERGTRA